MYLINYQSSTHPTDEKHNILGLKNNMSGRGRGSGPGRGRGCGRGPGRGRGHGHVSGPGINYAKLSILMKELMKTCLETNNPSIIGKCAEILGCMDDKSEQVDTPSTTTLKSKLVKVIQGMIGKDSSVNCINLCKLIPAYKKLCREVFKLPDGMKLNMYIESLGFKLCRDPDDDKVMYVKIDDGAEFMFPTKSASDVDEQSNEQSNEPSDEPSDEQSDEQRSNVLKTIRDMIKNSKYGDNVGLITVMKNYAKMHGKQMVLPFQTKLSEYLKTFGELEMFTRGGVHTDMLVKFKTVSAEGGAGK